MTSQFQAEVQFQQHQLLLFSYKMGKLSYGLPIIAPHLYNLIPQNRKVQIVAECR